MDHPMPKLSRIGILADILAKIESGELPPGSKLPSAVRWAEYYECDPSTINWAMSILAMRGVVFGVRGAGRYVAGASPQDTTVDLPRKDPEQPTSG
jgi:DNA-binding GntR family transcriptional regulator